LLKKPASYGEQVAKLRENGCIISDEAFCLDALSRINYYRLSAYFLTYRTANGKFKSPMDFNDIYRLYEFDRKMRRLLFSAIEEVEIYLKSKISYYHAHKYGSDGYMNSACFNNQHDHTDFSSRINELIRNNNKVPFVKHHILKYNNCFPIWVIIELFTFGMVSYFYSDLPTSDQKRLARDLYNSVPKNVKSWLHCCTILRNICAHYGRLYYRIFTAIPANIPQLGKGNERRLFGSIMALRFLYPDETKWNSKVISALSELVKAFQNEIDLRHIGFPNNWEIIAQK